MERRACMGGKEVGQLETFKLRPMFTTFTDMNHSFCKNV
jgi:hypothetical protein